GVEVAEEEQRLTEYDRRQRRELPAPLVDEDDDDVPEVVVEAAHHGVEILITVKISYIDPGDLIGKPRRRLGGEPRRPVVQQHRYISRVPIRGDDVLIAVLVDIPNQLRLRVAPHLGDRLRGEAELAGVDDAVLAGRQRAVG